jgi:predicted acyltransferase
MDKTIKPERLHSLDILRGFDMFWITGGSWLVATLATATGWKWLNTVGEQMHHAHWAGFHFYDLIFPLFIFIMGVAIPYALIPKLEAGVARKGLYRKVIRRFVILVVLGILYNQVHWPDWTNPRIASVLGQIGFAYLFASIIFMNSRGIRGVILWFSGILVVYGLMQNFIPVPGHGAGVLTQEGSLNAFLDHYITPGRLLGGSFEPEGVFNNISAISIGLMGVMAGLILRGEKVRSQYGKVMTLAVCGAGFITIALLLNGVYPIIKNAWTATFDLLAGGISLMLLSLFYMVVDVWKYRKWGLYFKVIGMNSITVYLGVSLINFGEVSRKLLGGLSMHMGDWGNVLISVGQLAVIWYCLYLLYKNKLFLRI